MILAGRHALVWPKDGWRRLDLPRVADDCRALGFDGVILHSGLNVAREAEGRIAPFAAAGLRVSLGIGFPAPRPENLLAIAAGILAALRVPGIEAVELDAEGAYDGHCDDAAVIADRVLSMEPGALARCVDVPWWAPTTAPGGHATHPHWPSREFGRLVARRFPQCYGAPVEGSSARMLAWAREQWASLGAWPIAPCVQGYHRSVADHVGLLAAEPDILCWDYAEFDADCRTALHAANALRAAGFAGPDAVRTYQAAHGLAADGVCGPRTCAALGVC